MQNTEAVLALLLKVHGSSNRQRSITMVGLIEELSIH